MGSPQTDHLSSTADLVKQELPTETAGQAGVSRGRTYLLLTISLIEAVLFGCISGGWNIFVFVLKSEGVYREACPAEPQTTNQSEALSFFELLSDYGMKYSTPYGLGNVTEYMDCDDRDSHFSLAFTIASAASCILCFAGGLLFDRYGIRISRLTGAIMNIAALLCLVFSPQDGFSWLIYPGALFMTVASFSIMMPAYHLCNLMGSKASTGIAVFTGASTASGSMMVLIKVAAEAGYGTTYSLTVLLALQVIYIFNTLFIMPAFKVNMPAQMEPSSLSVAESGEVAVISKEKEDHIIEKPAAGEEKEEKQKSFTDCIRSPLILFHFFWFGVSYLRLTYYVGSFNAWVNSVVNEDKAKVSLYSDIYGYMLMGTIILSPLVGALNDFMRNFIKKLNLSGEERTIAALPSLVLAMGTTLLLSIVSAIQAEWSVLASIVLVTLTNGFVYPANSTYYQLGFPTEHFGKLMGVAYASAGVINFTQYGLFEWASTTDNFAAPAILLIVLVGLSCGHALHVYIRHRLTMSRRTNGNTNNNCNLQMDVVPISKLHPLERSYDNEITYL